jgi:hypothetical protein
MKRLALAIITANLAGIVLLAFLFPDAMLAPGKLIPPHASLSDNCFAGHAPLRERSSHAARPVITSQR